MEALLTPKPGLVDKQNNGAHSDMDLALFIARAEVLQPFFVELAEYGGAHKLEAPHRVFVASRGIGMRAEAEMLQATGGSIPIREPCLA
jgi:triphosphoribosyl-dephospho-CoA synthase